MISATVDIETQFYDLDPMGVVWHGNYARFFEQARCALLDKIGYNYKQMEETGYMWPVIDLQIRYIHSLVFPQKAQITATIVEYENRLKISYVIFNEEGKILTKGTTTQVAVDTKTKELCLESPNVLCDKIRKIL